MIYHLLNFFFSIFVQVFKSSCFPFWRQWHPCYKSHYWYCLPSSSSPLSDWNSILALYTTAAIASKIDVCIEDINKLLYMNFQFCFIYAAFCISIICCRCFLIFSFFVDFYQNAKLFLNTLCHMLYVERNQHFRKWKLKFKITIYFQHTGETVQENEKDVPCNMENKPGANHCETNVSICFEGWVGPNKGKI